MNESKPTTVRRDELEQGLQIIECLQKALKEMSMMAKSMLKRSGGEETVVMTWGEQVRMEQLRGEVEDIIVG